MKSYALWCAAQHLTETTTILVQVFFVPKGTEYVTLTEEEFLLFREQITYQSFHTWYYVEVLEDADPSMAAFINKVIETQRKWQKFDQEAALAAKLVGPLEVQTTFRDGMDIDIPISSLYS